MKKITITDFRSAVLKIAGDECTNNSLAHLSDEELFNVNIERDLHVFSGKIGNVIKQIAKDKRISLPHELHKVMPDSNVSTLVNTVNLCIQEEENLGLSPKF